MLPGMARIARIVVPGLPHHVTQRGNRRQRTFFRDEDYRIYISYLASSLGAAEAEVWAYCLMPNHVHLVVVPSRPDSLAELFRDAHRRYTSHINLREGWVGHLWQGRFHSCVLDDRHLHAAVRYVELNPVRAGLCRQAHQWRWSSVHAHLGGTDDALVSVTPMLERVADWGAYLRLQLSEDELSALREASRTGRPAGGRRFVKKLEVVTGRSIARKKPGPKAGAGRGDDGSQ